LRDSRRLEFYEPAIFIYLLIRAWRRMKRFIVVGEAGWPERRPSVLTGFSLLIVFATLGEWVLRIFDIDLYSFRIAGGALLLFLAFELLLKTETQLRAYGPEHAGAVPLGVPLLVGPGAITTAIIVLKTSGVIVAISTVTLAALMTWIILRFAVPIHEALGEVGANVVSKMMAMLLAAIAVQFILEGVKEYLEMLH
jgi:multiple antibiotic resistance protein